MAEDRTIYKMYMISFIKIAWCIYRGLDA